MAFALEIWTAEWFTVRVHEIFWQIKHVPSKMMLRINMQEIYKYCFHKNNAAFLRTDGILREKS